MSYVYPFYFHYDAFVLCIIIMVVRNYVSIKLCMQTIFIRNCAQIILLYIYIYIILFIIIISNTFITIILYIYI